MGHVVDFRSVDSLDRRTQQLTQAERESLEELSLPMPGDDDEQ
jgi:hypothetical protein